MEQQLKQLDPTKVTGPDNKSSELYKAVEKSIVSPLTSLYKFSAKTDSLPQEWKLARIYAAHKKDDETERGNNYRPLSMLGNTKQHDGKAYLKKHFQSSK